jgi:glycosyltransferase involved in cell wall biosynthesis
MKIRVLHVVHWPKSGIVSLLKNYLIKCNNENFEYHILIFIKDMDDISELKRYCSSVNYLEYERNKIFSVIKFIKIIQRISPSIIHTHSFLPGLWTRLLKIAMKNIQIISTIHSPYPYFKDLDVRSRAKRALEVWTINFSNSKVICVSEFVRQYLIHQTTIKAEKLCVIYNGIPIDKFDHKFKSNVEMKNIFKNNETLVLIYAGRLSEEKGLDILLKAFSILRFHMHNIKLLILGDGPLKSYLQDLSSSLKINDSVKFLGFKKEIMQYLLQSDLYISCSRFEGLPMSILEALSANLPVIATNVGGIPEVIKNDVHGILIEPNNPELLAKTIRNLLSSERELDKFKKNGRERVSDFFDIKKCIQNYERLYLHILGYDKL